MDSITLKSQRQFCSNIDELIKKFNEKEVKQKKTTTFYNSEASPTWIIRGCIKYFDKLDTNFLGDDNASGIPGIEADRFANNLYRLVNSIQTLSNYWGMNFTKNKDIQQLLDIRTLIVHSGENIDRIISSHLEKYKDIQLGKIFKNDKNKKCNFIHFKDDNLNMDYCIKIWADKHDKTIRKHRSEADYGLKNQNYLTINLYLKARDVRSIVLNFTENFIENVIIREDPIDNRKLPEKKHVIDEDKKEIDFDKISQFIKKDSRGGFFTESEVEHWDGYGLERLFDYAKKHLEIPGDIKNLIIETIMKRMIEFWTCYQNNKELPSLNICDVFHEYTPKYKTKHYFEGEKLFLKIAPFFNTGNRDDAVDINYLIQFLNEVNKFFDENLNLEQSVDQIICNYIVSSVIYKKKIKNN